MRHSRLWIPKIFGPLLTNLCHFWWKSNVWRPVLTNFGQKESLKHYLVEKLTSNSYFGGKMGYFKPEGLLCDKNHWKLVSYISFTFSQLKNHLTTLSEIVVTSLVTIIHKFSAMISLELPIFISQTICVEVSYNKTKNWAKFQLINIIGSRDTLRFAVFPCFFLYLGCFYKKLHHKTCKD